MFVSPGHVGAPLPCNSIKLVDVAEMNYLAANGEGEVRDTLAGWFTGRLVHWQAGSLAGWFTGKLVHWQTGSLAGWFTGRVVHW